MTRSNAALASQSRSQARFFSGSPIQVARVPCTQLPAMTCRSGCGSIPRARQSDRVVNLEQQMIRQARVQGTQEVIAVEGVMFPCILAVERDDDGNRSGESL